MATATKKDTKPLPLNGTLCDLALLRATDTDLSRLIPQDAPNDDSQNSDVDASVAKSYEFVREARAAIKLHDKDLVEEQGNRVEVLRGKLEEVVKGLGDDN